MLIGRITAKVEAANPFDGHNAAINNRLSGAGDGCSSPYSFFADNVNLWPAVVTADRLGIITPGGGTIVFSLTTGAHGKFSHAGAFPVIRHGI